MTVKAWLEGHPFDLGQVATMLASGEVCVVRGVNEDGYYLTAPAIDNPPEVNRFDIPAERLLVRINGLARVQSADFRPIKLSGKCTAPDGTNMHFAVANLEARVHLTATAVVVGPDGQPQPDPPSPWPDYVRLANTHPEVAEVLDIMGRAEPLGWVDLYKVHEIVRDAVETNKLTGLGWTTKAEVSAFTGSANRADVSGTEARHARNSGATPTRTMSLAEGRSYVGHLVTSWLDMPATDAGHQK